MSARGLGCYPLGLRPSVLYSLTMQISEPRGFWVCAGSPLLIKSRAAYRAAPVATPAAVRLSIALDRYIAAGV